MERNYTEKLNEILQYSKEEAIRLKNRYIGPEHIMLGILRDGNNIASDILTNEYKIDLSDLKNSIESEIHYDLTDDLRTNTITLNETSRSILHLSILESRLLHSNTIDVEHIFLAIMRQKNNIPAMILNNINVSYNNLHALFKNNSSPKDSVEYDENDEDDDMPPTNTNSNGLNQRSMRQLKSIKKQTSDTPVLDSFGYDLTHAAQEGLLDPVVGREKELERVAQILNRKKKNNPILIGEPGVGKSSIAEGLAQRIIEHKVSRALSGKRVVSLDMTSVVAGTKFRGQFEERIKSIITELKNNKDIILFIDEIHLLIGAGNLPGEMDAANMFKPALSRGELQCIGATTLKEYSKSIEKDGALERRFQKIIVEPTNTEETLQILQNIKDRYEEYHNVTYTDDALKACVTLTNRYIKDRQFPDKAIDAMDEAGSKMHINNITVPKEIEDQEEAIRNANMQKDLAVKNQNYELAASYRDRVKQLELELAQKRQKWESSKNENREIVNAEHIAETVSMMSGVPINRITTSEGIRIKGMRASLKQTIISQDSAIDTLVSAIQRNRIGLNDPNRPIGTFMFIGPTGVGKTYLAKELAEYMFGSSDSIIRIDMSEYMEKFNASRLVGAPPGYVGYEEGGYLTEQVRRKPYSIVLFDEIEKAHPDIFNILLQIMDDGRLTDNYGRTVDFRNTIIIMTSNAGTRQLKDYGTGIGFATMSNQDIKENSRRIVRKALEKQFSPEFLNRIDDIITFDQLDIDAIIKIVNIELEKLIKRMTSIGYMLKISIEAKEYLAKNGYDKQFGARPLRRAIQTYLENPISDLLVENSIEDGTVINVNYNKENDNLTFNY